jgi:alkyl sulfatase BDS1-like metallo-beta-lactamase superfamily hydrolase
MAALGPQILLPGHGLPIVGAERIEQALTETAALLESLVEQTMALMNQGAAVDRAVNEVRAPEHLLARPYLRPLRDDPEFVVRNVWRENGGWYGGNPSELKPARDAELARELATLTGGAGALAGRARELAAANDLRLAGHLAKLAFDAAPDDADVRAAYAEVFDSRARAEPSMIARSIFASAAEEARASDPTGEPG